MSTAETKAQETLATIEAVHLGQSLAGGVKAVEKAKNVIEKLTEAEKSAENPGETKEPAPNETEGEKTAEDKMIAQAPANGAESEGRDSEANQGKIPRKSSKEQVKWDLGRQMAEETAEKEAETKAKSTKETAAREATEAASAKKGAERVATKGAAAERIATGLDPEKIADTRKAGS